MNDLKYVKISDLADVIVGFPFKSDKFNVEGKGIRLVRGMNVSEKTLRFGSESRWWSDSSTDLQSYFLKSGDILIGMDGSKVGKNFAMVEEDDLPLLLVQRVACIRAKDSKLQNFIWACISSGKFTEYVESIKTGSSIPHISKTQIEDFKIPFEDKVSAYKSGEVIYNIDQKISSNNKTICTLESLAKTIYDYWFLQFEFPNKDGKPYKSSGGKMVWNDELKREIPEGWRNGNLYDVADFVNGLACQKYRPKNENDDKLRVIKITEMHDGFTENTEFVSSDVPTKYIIHDGDILFSWSASLEVMLWNNGKGCLNQHIFKVNPKNYGAHYVYMQLASYVINFVKLAEARKTTMGHITTDHLKQSKICLPDSKVADLYEQKMLPLFTQITNLKQENQKLASLRDFLLPMLMNGQVTFKEEA